MKSGADITACGLYVGISVQDYETALRDAGIALANPSTEAILMSAETVNDSTLRTSRAIVELSLRSGTAIVVRSNIGLACNSGADGLHLPCSTSIVDDVKSSRSQLPSDAILGADAGQSRHTAMTLGETGVDYVAFSLAASDAGSKSDTASRVAQRNELVAWWSELFEVPSVAFDVGSASEAAELAQAGADFIAVNIRPGQSAADSAAWLEDISAAIATHASGVHHDVA